MGLFDNTWETFLRIDSPPVDPERAAWLAAKQVEPEAPAVLRLLRDCVLPLVRELEATRVLNWYALLVHDRESGVPTTPEDASSYIHLRLAFDSRAMALKMPPGWAMTRRVTLAETIPGVDVDRLAGGAERAWRLIGDQSRWMLDLIESLSAVDDERALVLNVRQYLHYFANLAQMQAG